MYPKGGLVPLEPYIAVEDGPVFPAPPPTVTTLRLSFGIMKATYKPPPLLYNTLRSTIKSPSISTLEIIFIKGKYIEAWTSIWKFLNHSMTGLKHLKCIDGSYSGGGIASLLLSAGPLFRHLETLILGFLRISQYGLEHRVSETSGLLDVQLLSLDYRISVY